MVKGLNLFKDHFEKFTDHYILIGGGACDVQFAQKEIPFRATKDLDIILIVEALSDDFVNHFWDFVKAGEYSIAEVDSRKCFYRFIKPAVEEYPKMLELFARKPDVIAEIPDFHITDIPTGEEASSLSAILMDDIYYAFTIENSVLIDGLHVANEIALITLKAKAFLNNKQPRSDGQNTQDSDINKHRNDVIRLASVVATEKNTIVPEIVATDLEKFIEVLVEEKVDFDKLLKQLGLGNTKLQDIIDRIQAIFGLRAVRS